LNITDRLTYLGLGAILIIEHIYMKIYVTPSILRALWVVAAICWSYDLITKHMLKKKNDLKEEMGRILNNPEYKVKGRWQ